MSLPLANYKSECAERQRIIVSKETPNEHRAINKDACLVRQFKVDGYVITENIKKCDYLVLNDDRHTAYFIELKGSDITGAIEQIRQTVEKLEKYLSSYVKKLRIVYSGQVNSGSILAWKKRNRNADARRKIFEENI
jgi:hypothetical protein